MQKSKKLQIPIKFKMPSIFLLLALFLIFIIQFLNNVVNPIIIETSSAKTRALSQMAVETAVYETVKCSVLYNSLIDITTDQNGKVSYITTNSLQINLLARELAKNAQKKLEEIGSAGVNVPVGTFTGVPIFVGRGPNVNIKLLPIGSITSKFTSQFINAGINQTNHKIYLTITTNVSVILPLENHTIQTVTQLLIAESIIVGEIPETYLQSGSQDLLNLAPQ